ncbi:MAG TPA: restriction endonuclease [Phycisphaerales bacterium]|nr:restriction endonuclease [Phycisphaerales bacterium]
MTRRRRSDSSFINELFDFLACAPTWVGPCVAAGVYVLSRWLLPWFFDLIISGNELGGGIAGVLSTVSVQAAPLLGVGTLLVWIVAEFKKRSDVRLLDSQSGQSSVRALDWQAFETLLSEAFRRQGFQVEHSGKAGPDGGVDLRLHKAGAKTLVQCKHWRRRQVGVNVVRELLGVVKDERAQSGVVVTSGQFSPDAIAFASRNPIRLIDGRELVDMLAEVQTSGRIAGVSSPSGPAVGGGAREARTGGIDEPACPECGSPMVRRVAKSGRHAGSAFWGCSRFPDCRGIVKADPVRL